jgi:hypothetical protein
MRKSIAPSCCLLRVDPCATPLPALHSTTSLDPLRVEYKVPSLAARAAGRQPGLLAKTPGVPAEGVAPPPRSPPRPQAQMPIRCAPLFGLVPGTRKKAGFSVSPSGNALRTGLGRSRARQRCHRQCVRRPPWQSRFKALRSWPFLSPPPRQLTKISEMDRENRRRANF